MRLPAGRPAATYRSAIRVVTDAAVTDERRSFGCRLMQVHLGMRDERVALRGVAEVVILARVRGAGRFVLHMELHAADRAVGPRADIRRRRRRKHLGYR